jgi:hypothetical protein
MVAKIRYVGVTAISLTGIDEIVKISAPLNRICGGPYIDCTNLTCVVST